MKTLFLTLLTLWLIMAECTHLKGQVTVLGNTPIAGAYLGWNAGGANGNLDFRTNAINRMRLMQTGTSTINGFSIDRGGFLGLSQDPTFFTSGVQSPFSLLHLNGDNPSGLPQQAGYRDWMRYGLTFTHNQDFMYVGQRRVGATDVTDAVIAWADNGSGSIGPDNLTFLFTPGAGGDIECARMIGEGHTGIGTSWSNIAQPKRTLDVIRIDDQPQFRITRAASSGLLGGTHADFQVSAAGNLHIRPRLSSTRAVAIGFLESELPDPINAIGARLDVGGITRIRNIPQPEVANCLIVGNNVLGNQSDNVLTRLDFPNDPTLVLSGNATWVSASGNDCRWEDKSSPTIIGEIDLRTGYSTSDPCYRGKVGIGVFENKNSKLDVLNSLTRDRVNIGISSLSVDNDLNTLPTRITGIIGTAQSQGGNMLNTNIGVEGSGGPGKYTVGLLGEALGGTNNAWNFGTYVSASGAPTGRNVGIYTEVPSSFDYASYTVGSSVSIGGPAISLSDENFKTDIQLIESPVEKLNQIQTHSYYFHSPDNRALPFDQEMQYGFLAQQVLEVLPHLVAEIAIPEMADSTGFIEGTGMTALGAKYEGFIPLLVAGFNEQSGVVSTQASIIQNQAAQLNSQAETIAELQSQVENMQQQMSSMFTVVQAMQAKTNSCCNDVSTGSLQAPASTTEGVKLMQNVPNPFETHTRIDFNLPADANVVLELSDAQGRPLRRLVDGQMNAGPQTLTLDGSTLAPGMYFYTVYANGEMITKKMVKK